MTKRVKVPTEVILDETIGKLLRQGVFFAWLVAGSEVVPRLHGWPVTGEWLPLLRQGLQGAIVGFVFSMTGYWLIYRRRDDAQ